MNDQTIEQEIQDKRLTAPRITPADIEANIVDIEIVKHVSKSGQVLRWAVLTARNGYAVVGKPSCAVSSANDNAELGEKIALENSKDEFWPLMGYALRSKLAESERVKQRLADSDDVDRRIQLINAGHEEQKFSDDELVYAANARCSCGAGMAYPKNIGMHGSWHCSDILTFRAATKDSADSVGHTSPLPFSFYSVKSENQPSACGATTRPAAITT